MGGKLYHKFPLLRLLPSFHSTEESSEVKQDKRRSKGKTYRKGNTPQSNVARNKDKRNFKTEESTGVTKQ